jgi:hypothetical protein
VSLCVCVCACRNLGHISVLVKQKTHVDIAGGVDERGSITFCMDSKTHRQKGKQAEKMHVHEQKCKQTCEHTGRKVRAHRHVRTVTCTLTEQAGRCLHTGMSAQSHAH